MTHEEAYNRLDDEHLDAVDAAVFSGDIFHDEDNRKKFRKLLERWTREMDALDASGFGLNP
jgi:DNA repair exonuclease SbcCD nuclease subunit